uniref:Uncharacterized protein n=1 Tax=Anguilla anguilla TaxID=7936 RepID=A0A0E9UG30_ANGAN
MWVTQFAPILLRMYSFCLFASPQRTLPGLANLILENII